MKSEEVVALRPDDLTLRKLDVWCNHGVFGADKVYPGRGRTRVFSEQEARMAAAIGAISRAFENRAPTHLYAKIVKQLSDGSTTASVSIEPGITLTIDLGVLQ